MMYLVYKIFSFISLFVSLQLDMGRISKVDPNTFYGVSIRARTIENEEFIVFKFSYKENNIYYSLPNFERYDSAEIANPQMLDILKFGKLMGAKSKSQAYIQSREFSENIIRAYQKIKVGRVFSIKEEGFVTFYTGDRYLIYVPDRSKIVNPSWRERIQKSILIATAWYGGREKLQ